MIGTNLNKYFLRVIVISIALVLISAACAPKATPISVDTMATAVAQAASVLLTQTAASYSPTPPPATVTPTFIPTDTATVTPAGSQSIKPTVLRNFAACWFGPGPAYVLESNIKNAARVEILGIGSVSGWYIIANPYFHKPCWIQASELEIDPARDLSKLPIMTPGP